MAVAVTITLPDQPTAGKTDFIPLGGDGTFSPLGCFVVDAQIAGDASGGNAVVTICLDPRYTNLVTWMNPRITSAAAAAEVQIQLTRDLGGIVAHPGLIVNGDTTFDDNVNRSSLLWYPPPMFFPGAGCIVMTTPNVDATEGYSLTLQVYCFDIDIRRITALPMLIWNVPSQGTM